MTKSQTTSELNHQKLKLRNLSKIDPRTKLGNEQQMQKKLNPFNAKLMFDAKTARQENVKQKRSALRIPTPDRTWIPDQCFSFPMLLPGTSLFIPECSVFFNAICLQRISPRNLQAIQSQISRYKTGFGWWETWGVTPWWTAPNVPGKKPNQHPFSRHVITSSLHAPRKIQISVHPNSMLMWLSEDKQKLRPKMTTFYTEATHFLCHLSATKEQVGGKKHNSTFMQNRPCLSALFVTLADSPQKDSHSFNQ